MPITTLDDNSFVRSVGAILQHLFANHGFTVPFYAVLIDRNSNLEFMHYTAADGHLTPQFMAEHFIAGAKGIGIPMTALFLDSATGKAVYTTITADQRGDDESTFRAAPRRH
jgi:hypothetical protein